MRKHREHRKEIAGCSSCFLTVTIMVAAILELMLFSYFFAFTSGVVQLLILLILQPLGVNLLLMIPMKNRFFAPRDLTHQSNTGISADNETSEKKNNRWKCIMHSFLSFLSKQSIQLWDFCYRFFMARRITCVTLLIGMFLLLLHGFYWSAPQVSYEHTPSIFIPLAFVSAFLVFLVTDIWCSHEYKDNVASKSRYVTLLYNLYSVIRTVKFFFLAAAAIETLSMLGIWDLHRAFFYLLRIAFICETGWIVYLYAIRLLKQELNTEPDLSFTFYGRKKGDLDILSFLEANTGITMRSLWSISLMKIMTPWAIVIGLIILWISTGIVQVQPNENGALYRLGRLKTESLKPGVHITLPWPFDTVDIYDTESLKEITVGYISDDTTGDNLWTEYHGGDENKLLLGGGNELVSINLRIEYKIEHLSDYLKCSNAPESLLESAAYEAITANTISTDLETLLDVDRVAFAKRFEEDLRNRISHYDTGLDIVDVVIESIHPPVEVAGIYQKIISAGIDAEKIILDAQARAAVALEKAHTSYDTDVNTAMADSHTAIADARSSVAEFMASLDADMTYGGDYRYYKYLNALEQAYSNSKLIIIGDGIDSSHLFLGKLPTQ